jgi:hypothetical protein
MVHGAWAVPVHSGPRIGPQLWLTGAQPSGRLRPRWLAVRVTRRDRGTAHRSLDDGSK